MPRQISPSATPLPKFVKEYALVVASVALTTLVRVALDPILGHRAAFIMFFPALVFSAWVGGWGGGLCALALSAFLAVWLFLSPAHALSIAGRTDQITLVVFILVGVSVSAISSSQRKSRQQAEDSAADARRAELALRSSEARKSAVLEVALDCIITTDAQGRILEFNPAAEHTFGYARAEVLGLPIAETIVPPPLRGASPSGLGHSLLTGDGTARQRVEVVGMRKGGEEFPMEVAVAPMRDGDGFTAYLRDITTRRNAIALQRAFLRDVLASVTEGHLILCDTPADLPQPLSPFGDPVRLTRASGLRDLRHLALDAAGGMTEERRHDLVTAVSEAGMNVITHGGGQGTGRVFVGADGTVQVRVEDQGAGIALESLPKATLARGFSTKASLGHGFKMMQQIDTVFVLTGPTGTTVVLEQSRQAVSPTWLS